MSSPIDVAVLLAQVDLVALIGWAVKLRKSGREYSGLCPFHDESTPSFTVSPAKGFYHCFGCGAHGNAIGFLMQSFGIGFLDACERLGHAGSAIRPVAAVPDSIRASAPSDWVPLLPVPDGAVPLVAGDGSVTVWNPRKGRWSTLQPTRVDEYRGEDGRLLGAVLRIEFNDRTSGKPIKITPQVTWCVGRDGSQRWCMRPFPKPRPLQGLDRLRLLQPAPVLIVEGEKCRAAATALLRYVAMTWPGGAQGIRHVDFSPLKGRDVVLWPDADRAGREAMLGHRDYAGVMHDGVAQLAWRAGCRSLRYIDVGARDDGWDIADALDPDGDNWSMQQLSAWAAARVCDVEVQAERCTA